MTDFKPIHDPKGIYQISYKAKIARTVANGHFGDNARQYFWNALPREFHADFPLAVRQYLQEHSIQTLPSEPDLDAIKEYWAERLDEHAMAAEDLDELAERSRIAKLKLINVPELFEPIKQRHFKRWCKKVYQAMFSVKHRAGKLSDSLYKKKEASLALHSPIAYHQLPSGACHAYYEIDNWGFHGPVIDESEVPDGFELRYIEDFQHLNMIPRSESFVFEPWDDMLEKLGWQYRDLLGREFWEAAHADFEQWLAKVNAE